MSQEIRGPGKQGELFTTQITPAGNGAQDATVYAVRNVVTFRELTEVGDAVLSPEDPHTEVSVAYPSANIRQAAPHLLGTLAVFADENKKNGLLDAAGTKLHGARIDQDLGTNKTGVLENATFMTGGYLGRKARDMFTQAFKLGLSHEPSKESVEAAFNEYYKRYGGREKSRVQARNRVRDGYEEVRGGSATKRKLAKELLALFDGSALSHTMPLILAYKKPELPTLTTIEERFGAVRKSPDSGFVAGSKGETTQTLRLLAGQRELGMNGYGHNSIMKIGSRAKHNFLDAKYSLSIAKWHEVRAAASVLYEYGDRMLGAEQALVDLADLERLVAERDNPNIAFNTTVEDLTREFHPAFKILVRNQTLQMLSKGQITEKEFLARYGFRPLTDRELRPNPEPLLPTSQEDYEKAVRPGGPLEKYAYMQFSKFRATMEEHCKRKVKYFEPSRKLRQNKKIYDPFTYPEPSAEVVRYVKDCADVITVGDLRLGLLESVILSERNRYDFFLRAITNVRGASDSDLGSVRDSILRQSRIYGYRRQRAAVQL